MQLKLDWKTIATLSVTILLAFSGYAAKYSYDLRLNQQRSQLERVDRQLRELYGPLFSLARASTTTWSGFVSRYQSKGYFQRGPGVSPKTEEEKAIWRHWMTHVFMPLNEEMARIVTAHADLLDEQEMPDCLLLLEAHVNGYKGVIKSWGQRDYSEHMSLTPFPGADLLKYSEGKYRALKAQQAELLGRARPSLSPEKSMQRTS